jgi:S1-C subfamily serine protease
VVTLVLKQSPAECAGLQRGDILTQLNGKPFTKENAASLPVKFAAGSSGTAVRATYAGGVWKEEEPLTVGMMYTFEHAEEPERTSQPDNRANEHSVDNILVQ